MGGGGCEYEFNSNAAPTAGPTTTARRRATNPTNLANVVGIALVAQAEAASKADAQAARDAALIEKAAKVGAKISNADARRLGTVLRALSPADFAAYETAAKGKRHPLATAVRIETNRRKIAADKAVVKAAQADVAATPKPAKAATPRPARVDHTDAVVALWNEPTALGARARRKEIAVKLDLRGRIASILRSAGLDADRIPNPIAETPAETPAEAAAPADKPKSTRIFRTREAALAAEQEDAATTE